MAQINKKFPLIIENHPDDYTGYPFITLIAYGNDDFLTIVDNYNHTHINAYVIDYCGPELVDEELLIETSKQWYFSTTQKKCPISVIFSRGGVLGDMKRIHKTFNINYVKRIIGPLPKYDMESIKRTKRKKRKITDVTVPINFKPLVIF